MNPGYRIGVRILRGRICGRQLDGDGRWERLSGRARGHELRNGLRQLVGGLRRRLHFLFCAGDLRQRLCELRVARGLALVGVGNCFLLRGQSGLQAEAGVMRVQPGTSEKRERDTKSASWKKS